MLYTKKDLKFLKQQAKNPNFGSSVKQYYKDCVRIIERDGKVDTERVRDDGDE